VLSIVHQRSSQAYEESVHTYFGETLTQGIARELIQELFTGRIVQKQEMMRVVDETHRERGGEPSAAKYQPPVTLALLRMKREGHADNPSQGN